MSLPEAVIVTSLRRATPVRDAVRLRSQKPSFDAVPDRVLPGAIPASVATGAYVQLNWDSVGNAGNDSYAKMNMERWQSPVECT